MVDDMDRVAVIVAVASVVVPVLCAVAAWALAINGKLGSISETLRSIQFNTKDLPTERQPLCRSAVLYTTSRSSVCV